MSPRAEAERWERLMQLLAPIHAQAARVARRLCRSTEEGDDLYQETVLRAFDKLDGLRDESKFRSWFYATLLSRHRSRWRRARRDPLPIEGALDSGREPAGEDGSAWEHERRQADRVARALSRLPAEQREAIVLHEIEGYSVEEVAVLQGGSSSAVKARLARGRERLRRFYERELAIPQTGSTAEGAPAQVAWRGEESSS
jgi:RNA polymerase sigma-70 factor (ECF subfamily)